MRNRSDGAVEALVCGPPGAIEALVAEMRSGPRAAVVESLSVIEHDETDGGDAGSFIIQSTA